MGLFVYDDERHNEPPAMELTIATKTNMDWQN
jgi:hypothetical protein